MRKLSFGLFFVLLSTVLRASEVAGVLSSDSPYYREAFQAFQQAFGATVPVVMAGVEPPALPAGVRVAVTFGAKASLASYAPGMARISCVTPMLGNSPPPRPFVHVRMVPPAPVLIAGLKEVHPRLKNLLVFWVSGAYDQYERELERAGKAAGLKVTSQKLADGGELAGRLGALKPEPGQALWIPPDPGIINTVNVSVLLQYASFNRVPFFSPSAQFVEMGAAGALAPDLREIGRLAAAAARDALAGKVLPDMIFPDKLDLFINRASLQHVNVAVTPELLKKAKTVY